MFDRALYFYDIQLKLTPDDFETKSLQLEAFASLNAVEKMAGEAEKLIELYPLEPKYYLYAGQSNNAVNNYKKALEWLEAGLDYVIDNPKLEADFYNELSKAHRGLGNTKKAEHFKEKASKLKK
jgi:tetratricopeptide (TPR) repeat protein